MNRIDRIKELQAPLSIDEVSFRIGHISIKGSATMLAYKNARADINRLNKAFGLGYWQRKHERIGTKEFCSVGVWNEEIDQWCWVQDIGTESYTEKEKGESSDAFKRACFNLGIGIELYDYPVIRIQLKDNEFKIHEYNNKKTAKPTWNLELNKWVWHSIFENGKLAYLGGKDTLGNLRFKFDKREKTT